MVHNLLKYSFFLLLLVAIVRLSAQQTPKGPKAIQQLIDAKQYHSADSMIRADMAYFLSIHSIDTMAVYLPLMAEAITKIKNATEAQKSTFAFVAQLPKNGASNSQTINAYRALAEYFGQSGQLQTAYEASMRTLEIATNTKPLVVQQIAKCHYNLGVYANNLGDVANSGLHHRIAMQLRAEDKNCTAEDRYLSYNSMGAIMWYASKYDSAIFYYNQSLKAVDFMPQEPLNKFYRKANIYNNISAVYSAEGKTTDAIETIHAAINNYKKYIAVPNVLYKKESAIEGYCGAIDNMASFYKEVGDYGKAGDLLRYSFVQKQEKLPTGHPDVYISQLLLGMHYNDIRAYDSAKAYLTKGLANLEKADGAYLFWMADGWFNLAMVHVNTGNVKAATACYKKAEELYEQSYQGSYDNVYMDFLRQAAIFYAKHNAYDEAMMRAKKVITYLNKIGQQNSLEAFYQLLNIAEINYETKHYAAAKHYAYTARHTVQQIMQQSNHLLDSIKMQVFLPKTLLIKAKAEYALQPKKDTIFLQHLAEQLDSALSILEQHKILLDDPESINILMMDHKDLIDFASKIALELYNKSYGNLYLEKFINLREASIYKLIRSRLDKERAIRYAGVPLKVLQEEFVLKDAIRNTLSHDKKDTAVIQNYLGAIHNWQAHTAQIKKQYPDYYQLRYAKLFTPLSSLQASLPPKTTLLRYYKLDTGFVVLIADATQQKIISIKTTQLEEKINALQQQFGAKKEGLKTLYDLYQQLWQPIAKYVHTNKVLVIPDGILYNLSFDMLATKPIKNYKALAKYGLIAGHTFSYHYSLFVLQHQLNTATPTASNYVAFAPGFSDDLKKEYIAQVKDSLNMDQGYLQLIQQPNTLRLAQKMKDLLGGKIFLNDASTKKSFRANAGNHKLIHIATHGVYNNANPEQSGLIFAKDSKGSDSNRLCLNDIFGCDMRSEVTILTACESGKPGYKDGEGMVSLAHAFNYAGSKNIITALWKIDEQASTTITENFIENVKAGLPTDEALRKSKIEYLQQVDDAQSMPSYWAGMILMGQPATINFAPQSNYILWSIVVTLLASALAVAVYFFRKKTNHST